MKSTKNQLLKDELNHAKDLLKLNKRIIDEQKEEIEKLKRSLLKSDAVKRVMNKRIKSFRQEFYHINKAINTEVATRNHMNMSPQEKGIIDGLIMAHSFINKNLI